MARENKITYRPQKSATYKRCLQLRYKYDRSCSRVVDKLLEYVFKKGLEDKAMAEGSNNEQT